MVPFQRVAAELRSLYQAVHEVEPGAVFDADAPAGWRPAERWEVSGRYDELLADAPRWWERHARPSRSPGRIGCGSKMPWLDLVLTSGRRLAPCRAEVSHMEASLVEKKVVRPA